jgi:acyl-CoA thioesterase I
MSVANHTEYLASLVDELKAQWPENRAVNIVCHGHSVPAGYTATPTVASTSAYPNLLRLKLAERFPFAVINIIVTAIGGENSVKGAKRFERDVLCHKPDVITLDYGLNDRGMGLEKAGAAWREMIELALAKGIRIILLTPTWDISARTQNTQDWVDLCSHSEQIRKLAYEYGVALADSFAAFQTYRDANGSFEELLCWVNHPSRSGHELVAWELLRWFAVH